MKAYNAAPKTASTRKFGIELETARCASYDDCEFRTGFTVKYDGSISGREFVSDPLSGDAGLAACVEFCRYANGRGFQVDGHCGYHLHLDVSNENAGGLSRIARAYYASERMWGRMVKRARRQNQYCRPISWNPNELNNLYDPEDWYNWADNQCRYRWFNVASYAKHGTFEVRLFTATLDANKVCAWIIAHTRFADWASNASEYELAAFEADTEQGQFDRLCRIIGDAEVCEFLAARGRFAGAVAV